MYAVHIFPSGKASVYFFPILVVGLLNRIHYSLDRICPGYILGQSWHNRPIIKKSRADTDESCVNS